MTSLHPDTFTPNLRKALNEFMAAPSINGAQAKGFIEKLDAAFSADAAKFGSAFVKGCPAYTEYQAASAKLQTIAAAAVNRVGDGRR